jgi:hypothetical protein
MPSFRLDQFSALRPDRFPIERADVMGLESGGAGIAEGFEDHWLCYVVLEGSLETRESGRAGMVSAGEVFIVAPGVLHSLTPRHGHAAVLRLTGASEPPFRAGRQAESMPRTIPLAGVFPSARRRGVAMHFDESKTFSPHLITATAGSDLALTMNLGAVTRGQTKEIRRCCDSAGRTLVALIIRVESDEDPMQFLLDKHRWETANELRPLHVGVEADLATGEGRSKAEQFRRIWGQRLQQAGLRFVVALPWREHTEPERHGLFEYLSVVPPALLPLWVRLESRTLPLRERQALHALLPWATVGISTREEGYDSLCHYLDGLGYQGWALNQL